MSKKVAKQSSGTVWKAQSPEPESTVLVISKSNNKSGASITCLPVVPYKHSGPTQGTKATIDGNEYIILHTSPLSLSPHTLTELLTTLPTPILTRIKRKLAAHLQTGRKGKKEKKVKGRGSAGAVASPSTLPTPPARKGEVGEITREPASAPISTPIPKKSTRRKYTPEDIAFLQDETNSIEAVMERYGFETKEQACGARRRARAKGQIRGA